MLIGAHFSYETGRERSCFENRATRTVRGNHQGKRFVMIPNWCPADHHQRGGKTSRESKDDDVLRDWNKTLGFATTMKGVRREVHGTNSCPAANGDPNLILNTAPLLPPLLPANDGGARRFEPPFEAFERNAGITAPAPQVVTKGWNSEYNNNI